VSVKYVIIVIAFTGGPADIDIVGYMHIFGKMVGGITAQVNALVIGVQEGALLVVVRYGRIIFRLFRAAAGREVHILHGRGAKHGGKPVIVLAAQGAGTLLVKFQDVYLIGIIRRAGNIVAVVLLVVLIQLAAVHHFHFAEIRHAEAGGDPGLELCFAARGFFGGNNEHACIGLRAVHSGGAGVLQHRYALHIVGIVVAANDAIHHVQGRLG